MSLQEQIVLIIYSILFGFIYTKILIKIINKLKSCSVLKSIIINSIYNIICIYIFFLLLVKINNGILHYYIIIFFILGTIANLYKKKM